MDRDNIVCTEQVELTVSVPPSDGITYQWIKDGTDIKDGYAGAKDQTLTITSFSLQEYGGHDGEYVCRVSRNGQSIDSKVVELKGLFAMYKV